VPLVPVAHDLLYLLLLNLKYDILYYNLYISTYCFPWLLLATRDRRWTYSEHGWSEQVQRFNVEGEKKARKQHERGTDKSSKPTPKAVRVTFALTFSLAAHGDDDSRATHRRSTMFFHHSKYYSNQNQNHSIRNKKIKIIR
jgi:hypothetical protein